MPRLATSLLRKAYAINRFLPPLLGTCRELQSAQNELRWLREHVEKVAKACRIGHVGLAKEKLFDYRSLGIEAKREIWRTAVRQRARKSQHMDKAMAARRAKGRTLATRQLNLRRHRRARIDKATREQHLKVGSLKKAKLLRFLVQKRAKGWPLQYELGTAYFGNLEIECRPGVLIPRPETAASVSHLARLIRKARDLPTELRVLDLCTGTGCIPLLFHHEFYSARSDIELRLVGIDISSKALGLANRNLQRLRCDRNYVHKGTTEFIMADILLDPFADHTRQPYDPFPLKPALTFSGTPAFWDILISNPPYISPSAFRTTTARSVRGFEPRLALVPPNETGRGDTEQGDAFYPILLAAAREMEVKVVLLEVADLDQALRVARMARKMQIFEGIEIWRDQPDQPDDSGPRTPHDFPLIGQGNGRSVLCWRGRGASWLGKGDDTKPPFVLPDYPKTVLHRCDDPHHHGPEGLHGRVWNRKLF